MSVVGGMVVSAVASVIAVLYQVTDQIQVQYHIIPCTTIVNIEGMVWKLIRITIWSTVNSSMSVNVYT